MLTSKDQAWVATKLAKFVAMTKPLAEILDMLTIHVHAELSRWCSKPVTLRKLRQRIHQEIVAGKMGTAEQLATVTAVVLGKIVNKK